jgi:TolB protein
MLIYTTHEDQTEMLAAVSLDGKVKVRLPARVGAVREPAWSPQLISNQNGL